ncbi:MAG: isochorismatase family protein [Candidatus Nitrosocosmicus sp.]|nr:cysteine hydrolase [Candidatus Nitrosocosmicus sp.]
MYSNTGLADHSLKHHFLILICNYNHIRDSIEATNFRIGLAVIDMHNGFISKGSLYNHSRPNIKEYQRIIPIVKELIHFCRTTNIPIFYTEAVREASSIDLLTCFHRFLPLARKEQLSSYHNERYIRCPKN